MTHSITSKQVDSYKVKVVEHLKWVNGNWNHFLLGTCFIPCFALVQKWNFEWKFVRQWENIIVRLNVLNRGLNEYTIIYSRINFAETRSLYLSIYNFSSVFSFIFKTFQFTPLDWTRSILNEVPMSRQRGTWSAGWQSQQYSRH